VISGLLSWFGRALAPKLRLESEDRRRLGEIEPSERVVYVLRRPSMLQLGMLREVCRASSLPIPLKHLADDSEGEPLYFSLRPRASAEFTVQKAIRTRKQRDQILTRFLDGEQRPLVFVPISIFAGLGPRPFSFERLLSFDVSFLPFRDLFFCGSYLLNRKQLRLEVGAVVKNPTHAKDLTKQLSQSLYRSEKLARGIPTASAKSVEQTVLSGERFENAVTDIVEESELSREQVYEEASKKFNEIAASMKWGAVKALYYFLRPVVTTVFQSVEVRGIDSLRKTVSENPTIVLPSHKSHFDYILVGWVFYHYKLPLPYVAAGANMNFFPVGSLLKAAGGFFIRRRIEGDTLYRTVLDNYLGYLVKKGHVVAFYIEGGRSRSGIARSPKLGLLKYLVQNWSDGEREDVALVPLGITYERIAEENALVEEEGGGKKKRESFFELLKLSNILRKRFGSVIFHVGETISLKEFRLQQKDVRTDEGDLPRFTEDLGFALSRGIMECTSVTGTSLCASALDSFPEQRLTTENLVKRMRELLGLYGELQGVRLPLKGERLSEESLEKLRVGGVLLEALGRAPLQEALYEVLGAFVRLGYVEKLGEDEILVPRSHRLKISYYKNTTLHYFLSPAVLTLSALASDCPYPTQVVHQFHQLFKHGFLLPFWRVWSNELRETLDVLSSRELLQFDLSSTEPSEVPNTGGSALLSEEGRRILLPLTRMFLPQIHALRITAEVVVSLENEVVGQKHFLAEVRTRVEERRETEDFLHAFDGTTSTLQFAMRALIENGFLLYSVDRFTEGGASSSAIAANGQETARLTQLIDILSHCAAELRGEE